MVVGSLQVLARASDSDGASASESADSDEELQEAFASGKLAPGLYRELPSAAEKKYVNNKAGLQQKIDEIRTQIDWIERLDLICEPAKAIPGETDIEDSSGAAVDDFKRELLFYRQAQTAVLEGLPRLQSMGMPTKRPEDYFAQMVKSDEHMKKVREKILAKQVSADLSEKAKKLREMRKFGKRVQQDVLLKRQKEKKEMLESVKKYRKGQQDHLDFLNDGKESGPKPGGSKKPGTGNKKRDWKNKKFGFGGQKKRSKRNTKSSASDTADFNPVKYTYAPGKVNKIRKQKRNARPGKSKRQKAKSLKR